MKPDQLIEYYLRYNFIEKSYTKCGGETIPTPFYKKSKLSISLDQYSKDLYILFLLLPSRGLSNVIETKLLTNCFYLLPHKALLKTKKRYGTRMYLIFCIICEKGFCCYVLLPDQISMSGCLYFMRY